MLFLTLMQSSFVLAAAQGEEAAHAPQRRLALGRGNLVDLTFSERDNEMVLEFLGEEKRVGLEKMTDFFAPKCGWKSTDENVPETVVTGCRGEDRFVTMGGVGAWELKANGELRTIELSHFGDEVLEVPAEEESTEILMLNLLAKYQRETGSHVQRVENRNEFDMTVKYYYDSSFKNKHKSNVDERIKQIHAHTAVLMRHESIGRKVHLVVKEDAKFMPSRKNAGSFGIYYFTFWLKNNSDCRANVAFHHLLTAKASDGTAGIAWLRTVCTGGCMNSGMTEDGWPGDVVKTGKIMAHEMGHNLGMSHNFDEINDGRNCKGYMSYDTDFDNAESWSDCAHDAWNANYDNFVATNGQKNADRCFVPRE